jgi:hypothetical protein
VGRGARPLVRPLVPVFGVWTARAVFCRDERYTSGLYERFFGPILPGIEPIRAVTSGFFLEK